MCDFNTFTDTICVFVNLLACVMIIPSRTQALGRSPSQDLRKKCTYHLNTLVSKKLMASSGGRRPLVVDILVPNFDSFLCLPFTRRFEGWFEGLVCCYPHTTPICTTQPHHTHLPGQVVEGVVPVVPQQPPSLLPAGCPENPSPSTSTPNILLVQTPT